MTGSAFYLTRRASLDLREIHKRSCFEWGKQTADRYLSDLYAAMRGAAANPQVGRLRQNRSAPFLMVAARKHFIVYDRISDSIVVLTVLHQARNVEAFVENMTATFLQEVERLKRI